MCAAWSSTPLPARSKARKSPAARKPSTQIRAVLSNSPRYRNATPTVTKDGFAKQTVPVDESKDAQITLAIGADQRSRGRHRDGRARRRSKKPAFRRPCSPRTISRRAQNPSIADYLRDVPGLSVVQTGRNGGVTCLFSRGGDSSSTLVLLDGVPLTEPGGAIDFAHLGTAGIDRMEVIRGPESALFGAEASSAVIQMFYAAAAMRNPTRPHGSFSYERGSFSTDHWTGVNRRRARASDRLCVHRRSVPHHRRVSERCVSHHHWAAPTSGYRF